MAVTDTDDPCSVAAALLVQSLINEPKTLQGFRRHLNVQKCVIESCVPLKRPALASLPESFALYALIARGLFGNSPLLP